MAVDSVRCQPTAEAIIVTLSFAAGSQTLWMQFPFLTCLRKRIYRVFAYANPFLRFSVGWFAISSFKCLYNKLFMQAVPLEGSLCLLVYISF